MIQQNELLTLLIGLGALTFLLANYRSLGRVPRRGWLLAGFGAALAGWVLTVAEGFVLPQIVNALEHLAYATSSGLLAIWTWLALKPEARSR